SCILGSLGVSVRRGEKTLVRRKCRLSHLADLPLENGYALRQVSTVVGEGGHDHAVRQQDDQNEHYAQHQHDGRSIACTEDSYYLGKDAENQEDRTGGKPRE